MKVNKDIVYKVTSQRGTWLLHSHRVALTILNAQMVIKPKAWVKEVECYQPGTLQEVWASEGSDDITWVNAATMRL